jgi:malonate-semialdehyde dehydrogenase (acetylating)/methylmalonate-semialdehyde dehydrogenase
MPDADPDLALEAIMSSAFGCAGQRCMAGSLLMGVGAAADPTRERLLAAMDSLRVADTSADDAAGMGPVIDAGSRDRLSARIDAASRDGLVLARDGRTGIPDKGFFLGPTLVDQVTPSHSLFREELFGPVLSLLRPETLEQAIDWVNGIAFGNGATIFTSSGRHAREFTRRVHCGMIGVNIGVPAAPALFPFSGWGESFYGDLHVQGTEGVAFYTRQKVVLSRW